MRKSQKLLLEQSEKRQKINDILAAETMTDEQRSELDSLTARMQEIEPELRAAITAEASEDTEARAAFGDDPEDREFRSLVDGSSIGAIFSAAVEHRQTDGRTAELQKHLGIGANQVPVILMGGPAETRAVTPGPANVGQNQTAIIPGVFPRSVAAFLGVDMPTVPTGEAVYPVLTTNAAAGVPDEGAVQAETTGAFSADVLAPARIQASFFYSREDRARFAGMDMALRDNLSMALSDKLDSEVLVGDQGFLGANGLANPANPGATATFADYRGLVYDDDVLDGLYAYQASDVRLVLGRHAYNHAATVYRANNADDSGIDSLMRVSGGVRISRHVPDPAANDQGLVVSKAPDMRNAVAPIWEGVTLIPDELTKASTGEIVVTAVMLHAVKILRAAAFARKEVQVA